MMASSLWRSRGARLLVSVLAVVGLDSGCLNRPIEPLNPVTTTTTTERLSQSGVDKIDLLFVIDNSPSMADKQNVLALAVPDLLGGLLNPPCISVTTGATVATPSGPTTACPSGSKREFPPVLDVHVGMVTSSLGSFGANGCPSPSPVLCANGDMDTSNDDQGQLVTRTAPCSTGVVPTYQNEGFLAWDPGQTLKPPGEGSLGDPNASPPVPGLETSLRDLVVGAGQTGCGFESQNEAWYRFLVDPSPYAGIELNADAVAVTSGLDTTLLQQRKQFLRPDSLLAIIVLTDETDTSIKEYGQYPIMAETTDSKDPDGEYHLPLPRQDCRLRGPLDPCCASCGSPTPAGCAEDPTCKTPDGKVAMYTDATENVAIRAFGLSGGEMSQKARYGIEFFYPPSRYVDALTLSQVPDATGQMVQNPIFAPNPDDPNATVRGTNLVFYAAITGVPWQLIARQDADGTPDLVNGLYTDPNTMKTTAVGGFKTYEELSKTDKFGHTLWDDIVGDPENYVLPYSPFMQESIVPRTGADPITGIATSPPGGAPNAINGTEYWTTGGPLTIPPPPALIPPSGDIEYACIFPTVGTLPNPGPCTFAAGDDNPLCSPDPNGGGMLQTKAKAYPGVKNLAIAKGMEGQGIAASICAYQLTTPNNPDGSPAQDYGYRPAVNAIIDRLKQALTSECLPRQLTPDPVSHQVSCVVLEAKNPQGQACSCDAVDRAEVPDKFAGATQQAQQQLQTLGLSQDTCICEIVQSSGADLTACETQASAAPTVNGQIVNGWCYVDESTSAAAATILENCPATQKQQIRFVGQGQPAEEAITFITCEGE